MSGARKPLRIFKSSLTGRYYAFRAYRELKGGGIVVTGLKEDVTDDIEKILRSSVKPLEGAGE